MYSEMKSKDRFSVELEVDPNEPTYCICKQVSFGEMIGKIILNFMLTFF